MKKNLLNGLVKASKNEHAGSIDVCDIYDPKFHVDTGNYMLNALIAGDMYKGIPSGLIIQLAGEKSTGKSYISQNILISHIKSDKNNVGLMIETEHGLIADQIKSNLTEEEQSRLIVYPCETIEQIKREMNRILNYIREKKEEFSDTKFLVNIDSIGMPASEKEMEDATNDKSPRDMTRAQSIKSLFRTICMKLGILQVPAIIVNHQYTTMDQWSPKEESGGSGVAYSNSITLVLTKKKLKDKNKIQVGTSFVVTPKKSRIVAENISKCEIHSQFKIGMNKYSGLMEFLANHKLIKSVGNGSRGGSTITFTETAEEFQSKDLDKMKPEEFWTKKRLDYVNEKFKEFYLLERAPEKTIEETLEETAK